MTFCTGKDGRMHVQDPRVKTHALCEEPLHSMERMHESNTPDNKNPTWRRQDGQNVELCQKCRQLTGRREG